LETDRTLHKPSQILRGESSDEQVLARFGYRQELRRAVGFFSSFALSFSVISVTTGLFANYGEGLRTAGPAFIWTWLIVGGGQLLVALVFARLATSIPLSGYAYHWARRLGGPNIAWWAGWMMIVQFITGMPGVCYALANYLVPYLRLEGSNRNVVLVTVGVLVLIALINHFGIRLASLVNNLSVGAEILGTVLIGALLLVVALWRHTHSWTFLFAHPAQPGRLGYVGAFAFSSLMSAWTLTGFEGAANLAEETHAPTRHIPRAIVMSEILSVALGFLVLLGFTLAIPALGAVAAHPTPLLFIINAYFPPAVTHATMLLVFISIFASALANLTTLTRMVWAMARDGQLPFSSWLSRVSAHRVPAHAIWTVTLLSSLFVLWAKGEVVITGIATLAGYVTYALVMGTTLRRREAPEAHESPAGPVGTPAVPRALGTAALVWTLVLLGMLSLPRSAWKNSGATLIVALAGAAWYVPLRRKSRAPARPAPGDLC